MTAPNFARLILLAFAWGITFLLIRVAAPVLGPVLLVESRVAIAGLVLLTYARALGLLPEFRARWRMYLMLGALNSALPFVLISYAQLRLEASFTAVLISTSPMFSALLGHALGEDRLSLRKLAGLGAGVAGVAILLGWHPADTASGNVLPRTASIVLVLGAALVYAIAAAYTRRQSGKAPGLMLATGSQLGAAALLLPLVPGTWPNAAPTVEAIACMLVLALLSSAFAFVLYFRLIADIGPVKTLSVNFIAPLFGVAGGVIALGEPLTASMVAGAAVILAGTWLALVPGARPES